MTDVSLLESLSRPSDAHLMDDEDVPPESSLKHSYTSRSGDGDDVVNRMKRDISYQAMARHHGNRDHSSSDERSEGSFHSDHPDKDAMGSSSQVTTQSVGSASRELEAIRKEEQQATEAIDKRRNWVFSMLAVTAVLGIIAMGAVGGGIQKERDFIEDMDGRSSQIQQVSTTTQPENFSTAEDTLTAANEMQQRNLHQSLTSFVNVMTQQAQTRHLNTIINIIVNNDLEDDNNNATTAATATASPTATPTAAATPPPYSSPWPFITNPLFEVQGQPTRSMLPQIELLAFSPLVTQEQQSEWNEYSWDQQHWIRDTWELLGYAATEIPTGNISPTIYQSGGGTTGMLLAPLWQTSPPPMEAFKINYNMLSIPVFWEMYQEITSATTTNSLEFVAAVSPVLEDLPYRYGLLSEQQLENMDYDDDVMQSPRSVLMVPVRETLAESADTVGLLQVLVNWEVYLRQIIPLQQGGTAQIRNNCGQSFSFRIMDNHNDTEKDNGNDVSRVSYLGSNHSLTGESNSDGIIIVEDILGIPGTGNGSCTYSLEFTPLQSSPQQPELQQQEEMDHDIVGILVLALVPLVLFLVVLALMGFYMKQWNEQVEERHAKLVHEAAKSSAIVTSMFPSTIRDRLMAQASNSMMGDQSSNSVSTAATNGKKKKKKTKRRSGSGSLMGNSSRRRSNDIDESEKDVEQHATHNANTNENGLATSAQVPRECYPKGYMLRGGSERLKNYLTNGLTPDEAYYTAPIADLFPNCTVVFADIAGFTAWSSVREPTQVFLLLETLYKAFDEIAKKRKVFKVETVGDCYVAVTGLPEVQEDHALIMVRFARDCMYKSYELTKKLEVSLGPDTAELSMRFGLHSGPVTAGVLRGDRSRFQLFGDTVNTASRMESTGQKGRIQMTQETADILIMMGKSHLVRQREDKVSAKGKGEMTTFWMALSADPEDFDEDEAPPPLMLIRNVSSGVDSIVEGNEDASSDHSEVEVEMEGGEEKEDKIMDNSSKKRRSRNKVGPRGAPSRRGPPAVSMSGFGSFKSPREKKLKKESRLVDWNVEVLSKLLKHVIARRNALGLHQGPEEVKLDRPDGQTVLEEVQEIITLPKFDASAAKKQEDPDKTELDPDVKEQLHEYVTTLASMYRENSFHNYEHASHVTMSVVKLLSRIVAPKAVDRSKMTSAEKMSMELHDHTYGITSDPLTQFAVVLSALIHDVDHTGVPNAQLVKENTRVAAYYKYKSIAEQNSLDLAWELWMEPQFRDLRTAVYCDESELTRFRSLLVNSVMATDIADKDQKEFRNARWEKAFSGEVPQTEKEVHDAVNRKATIVLEHLIQASDVSHTMQHWHVYRKWNERLYLEMHNAYRTGRAEKDPSEFWYKGEIGFFDFYIIPLAKKLKECGVFGVSSDEYLTYALKNREEWARKGEAVTAEMVAKARDMDLSRMERQASVRGPVIAEMKAAVLSMRSPSNKLDQPFRQPSFRHLSVEPEATESIAMPAPGFQRQPPTRRHTPNRSALASAVSMGSNERRALKQFRSSASARNVGGIGMRKPERRGSNC